MDERLQGAVAKQRAALHSLLEEPLRSLALRCMPHWLDSGALDRVLAEALPDLPWCHLLYALDTRGTQVSGNISRDGIDLTRCGQDLAHRPYLKSAVPYHGFLISVVYVSRFTGRPCVTAVQTVSLNEYVLGFVAADFDLRDLPLTEPEFTEFPHWRQVKGDPAIRGTLFMQRRSESPLDQHLETVLAITEELLCERGVFHGKLYFSGGRATIWLTDDPYRYRILMAEELIDPSLCLAYARRPFPPQASIPSSQVRAVLARFPALRNADETLYLRSASINVISGTVGLTFSCDGSHYMPADEFLAKDPSFWLGKVSE